MHELSVARHLIAHIERHVPPAELSSVRRVRVRIGAQSGVVRDSLEFSFAALTDGTPLAGAALQFDEIPFLLECRGCGARTTNRYGLAVCGSCGSADTTVLGGTELDIVQLELQDQRGH